MFTNLGVRMTRCSSSNTHPIDCSRDHTDKVLCVQFNLEYIVSGSTDKTIKVEHRSASTDVPYRSPFRFGVMQMASVCERYQLIMVQ